MQTTSSKHLQLINRHIGGHWHNMRKRNQYKYEQKERERDLSDEGQKKAAESMVTKS